MRIKSLDELRGLAFIMMIVHHVNYFWDVSNNYSTHWASNSVIKKIGTVSRTLFIILVGIGLYETYFNKKGNEWEYELKRIERSFVIFGHALFISLFTHYFYPAYGIKFGVLHFIGLASFLSIPFVYSPVVTGFLGTILYICKDYLTHPTNNPIIDTVLGLNIHFNMMDYFPLIEWLPLVFTGIFIGYLIHHQDQSIFPISLFEIIGQNSLNLYTVHIVILVLLYETIKKLTLRNINH